MCDYSLEAYKSRPARKGEQYSLHQFPGGSKGFVSPGDCATAVCIAPDTRLRLAGLPVDLGELHGLGPVEDAVFVRMEGSRYRDGVRFANGFELSLQRLPVGLTVMITGALDEPIPALEAAGMVA